MPDTEGLRKATITYYLEIFFGVITVVYLASLISAVSERRGEEPPNIISWLAVSFSEEFTKDGFCNGEILGVATQLACFIFDAAMAAAILIGLANISKDELKISILHNLGHAAFLVFHGVVHLLVHLGILDTDAKTSDKWITILAIFVMVGLGPLFLFVILRPKFEQAKWVPVVAAIVLEVILVYAYLAYIDYGIWALTYINISAFIGIFPLRPFLYKKDDISRIELYDRGNFALGLFSLAFMFAVIILEATLCDGFKKIGGHVWFDKSLFLVGVTNIAPPFGKKSRQKDD